MRRCGKPRRCAYCGVKMKYGQQHQGDPRQATRDHIVAKSAGGDETVRCCNGCNQDKQHLTLSEWRAALCIRYRRLHLFYFERQIPAFFVHKACFWASCFAWL